MAEEKKVTAKKATSTTAKKTAEKKEAAPKATKATSAKKPAAPKTPAAKKVTKVAAAPKKEVKEVKKVNEEVKLQAPVTEAKAIAKNVRCTPRKARLVIDIVRGLDVTAAINLLKNTNKAAATPVTKVIQSAAANAVNNFNLDDEKLYIAEIYATDGLRMKRFIPRAKGSASGLVKRTTHITCVVKERK